MTQEEMLQYVFVAAALALAGALVVGVLGAIAAMRMCMTILSRSMTHRKRPGGAR